MDQPTQQKPAGKEPGCLATFIVTFAVVIAAPVGGHLLGSALAPTSELAQTLGIVSPLASLVMGVLLWLGTFALRLAWKLLLLPFRLVIRLVTGRKARSDREGQDFDQAPPGTFAFVPVTVAVFTICGAGIGLLSETTGVLLATAVLSGTGLVYGVVLWRLAKHGYLDGVVEWVLKIAVESA
jgi:hypothetical protein